MLEDMESRNGNNVYRSNTKNINTVTRRKTNMYLHIYGLLLSEHNFLLNLLHIFLSSHGWFIPLGLSGTVHKVQHNAIYLFPERCIVLCGLWNRTQPPRCGARDYRNVGLSTASQITGIRSRILKPKNRVQLWCPMWCNAPCSNKMSHHALRGWLPGR